MILGLMSQLISIACSYEPLNNPKLYRKRHLLSFLWFLVVFFYEHWIWYRKTHIGSSKRNRTSLFPLRIATKPLSFSLFFWEILLLHITEIYVQNTVYMAYRFLCIFTCSPNQPRLKLKSSDLVFKKHWNLQMS